MKPADFIATARDLANANSKGRPRETNLRRAVSTTYYALFHGLATCCADMLVGGPGANRSQPAWRQAYRALQHRDAKQRCESQAISRFPGELQDFAIQFVAMQKSDTGLITILMVHSPKMKCSKTSLKQSVVLVASVKSPPRTGAPLPCTSCSP